MEGLRSAVNMKSYHGSVTEKSVKSIRHDTCIFFEGTSMLSACLASDGEIEAVTKDEHQ